MNVYFISYCVTIPPVNGAHEMDIGAVASMRMSAEFYTFEQLIRPQNQCQGVLSP